MMTFSMSCWMAASVASVTQAATDMVFRKNTPVTKRRKIKYGVLTIGQMIIKMKVADHDHTFDLLEQSGCWRPLMGPE